jgi:hypothetical protein
MIASQRARPRVWPCAAAVLSVVALAGTGGLAGLARTTTGRAPEQSTTSVQKSKVVHGPQDLQSATTPSPATGAPGMLPRQPEGVAPTTAAGYTKLWSAIPARQWGASDVALSVQISDGRSVWLYGDTFSGDNGFVHSTAITQNGGNLKVSNGGRQLIPNDSQTAVYWIEKAVARPANRLKITCAPMTTGTRGPWDFKRRTAQSRLASAHVDATGNVHFDRWVRYVTAPRPNNDFKVVGPHHFTYANEDHPELKLKSRMVLHTVCQNWDDPLHKNADGSISYQDYRPIFSAVRRDVAPSG